MPGLGASPRGSPGASGARGRSRSPPTWRSRCTTPSPAITRRRDPFGAAGDFITAPEISQIFGELIGACVADFWQRIGRPDPVDPGRARPRPRHADGGSAARGARRPRIPPRIAAVPGRGQPGAAAGAAAPPCRRRPESRRVSPTASTRCRTGRCCWSPTSFSTRCRFASSCAAASVWAERLVALDTGAEPEAERLVFVEGPESPGLALLVPPGLRDAPPGTVVEICPAAAALAASLGERLARQPGMALFIDYGYFPSRPGATLAALRRHAAVVDPRRARRGGSQRRMSISRLSPRRRRLPAPRSHGPVPQREFLLALGAEARLAALSRRAAPAQRAALESGLARLIDPAQMGNLFKVLALTSPGLPAPAGFAGNHDRDAMMITRR